MTTRQISDQIEEIYGFECSEGFISDVTDKLLQDIEDWQDRPLDRVYPILFIDAVHFSVREDKTIKKARGLCHFRCEHGRYEVSSVAGDWRK